MSCCKRQNDDDCRCRDCDCRGGSSFLNGAFIILVLYILLAIILGGILF